MSKKSKMSWFCDDCGARVGVMSPCKCGCKWAEGVESAERTLRFCKHWHCWECGNVYLESAEPCWIDGFPFCSRCSERGVEPDCPVCADRDAQIERLLELRQDASDAERLIGDALCVQTYGIKSSVNCLLTSKKTVERRLRDRIAALEKERDEAREELAKQVEQRLVFASSTKDGQWGEVGTTVTKARLRELMHALSGRIIDECGGLIWSKALKDAWRAIHGELGLDDDPKANISSPTPPAGAEEATVEPDDALAKITVRVLGALPKEFTRGLSGLWWITDAAQEAVCVLYRELAAGFDPTRYVLLDKEWLDEATAGGAGRPAVQIIRRHAGLEDA